MSPPDPSPAAPPGPDPRRWLMLPVILSATFLTGFDLNVVNVALPSLHGQLHAGSAALELVVGGYAFTCASGLVTAGRLGDLFGYRRLFLAGMTAFTVASALCGASQSPGELVAARLLQGLAAAAMAPQVIALITVTFPVAERPRALSWLAVTMGLSGVAGQVLGGFLVNADILGLGWRTIFLVNIPVGAVALACAVRLLPVARAGRRPRLDPVGAVGISGGLALVLVPLALGREEGWPLWTWLMVAAAVPVLALTLGWEWRLTRRGAQPLLDLTLFRVRGFTTGLGMNAALMGNFSSFLFTVSLLLQSGLHLNPLQAGLTFTPFAVVAMVTALLGQRLTARLGVRTLSLGAAVSTTAVVVLAVQLMVLGGGITAWWMQIPLCLLGVGNGLVLPLLVGAVIANVAPSQAGAVSGVLTTTQQFAGSLGLAAVGAVFFAVLGTGQGRADYASACAVTAWIDAGLLAVLLTLSLLLVRATPGRRSGRDGAGVAPAVAASR